MSVRSLRYNTMNQHITKSALASTDRDALAFLEAAQIYNTNQQRAIVNLVRSLKRVGLWSKMKAIYPFVGGTASSHKWNLKDPRDVDAAFRLSFSGGWTHATTGALPNGSNAYADTFLTPANHLTGNNIHLSFYSRTSTAAAGDAWGADDNSSPGEYLRLEIRFTGFGLTNRGRTIISAPGSIGITSVENTDGKGFYIANAPNTTTRTFIKNGVVVTPATQNALVGSGIINRRLYMSANNSGFGIYLYDNKECGFSSVGDGLTDSDATNLYNIVDLYQRRLGRAV